LHNYHRSSEHDQELLRHHVLLWRAEEAAAIKACELEEFQAVRDQEIENMQKELEKCDREMQEHDFELTNKDNVIENLLA
jgi:hypothetical protein